METNPQQSYIGGISCDDRGYVRFVNDFDPWALHIRRFYQVSNHEVGYIRAWHGHMHEAKYVYVVSGSIKLATVPISGPHDDWSTHKPIVRYLTAATPKTLYVPPAHANGFQTLEPNTNVMFFSTSTVQESLNDDIRFPWNYWENFNIWTNTYR